MATAQEDQDWLYDYILQFLKSPGWRLPIINFMDEHCEHFDVEDENKLIYTELHNKFRELIDVLLDNLCKELNITQEQFALACTNGMGNPTHRRIFEQILACDNFFSFKKLMIKRNKELQAEASQTIAQNSFNQGPAQVVMGQTPQTQANDTQEQAELQHAITLSLALSEEDRRRKMYEDEELQRVLRISELEYRELQMKQKQLEEESKKRQEEFKLQGSPTKLAGLEEIQKRQQENEERIRMERAKQMELDAEFKRRNDEVNAQLEDQLLRLDSERVLTEQQRQDFLDKQKEFNDQFMKLEKLKIDNASSSQFYEEQQRLLQQQYQKFENDKKAYIAELKREREIQQKQFQEQQRILQEQFKKLEEEKERTRQMQMQLMQQQAKQEEANRLRLKQQEEELTRQKLQQDEAQRKLEEELEIQRLHEQKVQADKEERRRAKEEHRKRKELRRQKRKEAEDRKIAELKRLRDADANTEQEIVKAQQSAWNEVQAAAKKQAEQLLPPVQFRRNPGAAPDFNFQMPESKPTPPTQTSPEAHREEEGSLSGRGETLEQRAARLKRQRDMILAKKRHERDQEMQEYLEKGGVDLTVKRQEPGVVELPEIQKRRHIAEKLREAFPSE